MTRELVFVVRRVPKGKGYANEGYWAIEQRLPRMPMDRLDDYVAYTGPSQKDKENAELIARLLESNTKPTHWRPVRAPSGGFLDG